MDIRRAIENLGTIALIPYVLFFIFFISPSMAGIININILANWMLYPETNFGMAIMYVVVIVIMLLPVFTIFHPFIHLNKMDDNVREYHHRDNITKLSRITLVIVSLLCLYSLIYSMIFSMQDDAGQKVSILLPIIHIILMTMYYVYYFFVVFKTHYIFSLLEKK